MPEENINRKFRLEKIDETRNYIIDEVKSVITGCVPIPAFAALVGIPIGITFSATGLKICAKTPGIKKYKSIIKKKKYKIVFLAKPKLNSIEVLISKTLFDSNVSHDELVLINNVLKECYDIKEEIKNSNNK